MKYLRLTLFLGILGLICSCASNKDEFSILDYGAVNDTLTLNTEAIQAAIDQCAEHGGRVVFPAGTYITGTIKLKSNVELHLADGAELLGSTSLSDYATDNIGAIEGPYYDKCLLYADHIEGVKITGKGLINGRGHRSSFPKRLADNSLGERPMLIRFVNCRDILMEDVTFMNAASWCTHMVDCDSVVIRNLTIDSHVNSNNDGLDLDGCKNVLIENCNIRSGDDGICPKSTSTRLTENLVIRNCRVESNTSAFKCGTSSRGGFRNISVSDCDFSDTRMGAIKLLLVDGGLLEDITISNITMDNVEGPIFIRLGNRGRKYDLPTHQIQGKDVQNEGVPPGTVKNIRISNIKAIVESDKPERCGIMISGIPGHYIENVVLENIEISYPGGGTIEDAQREVDEDEARYPEQFFFGVLPSWGAFIRHARDVEFRNVVLTTRSPDKREMIVLEDVEGFERNKQL